MPVYPSELCLHETEREPLRITQLCDATHFLLRSPIIHEVTIRFKYRKPGYFRMLNFQTVGVFVGVLAVLSAIADLMPNSPFKLKDLNEPQENLASHSDVWKLIFSNENEKQTPP